MRRACSTCPSQASYAVAVAGSQAAGSCARCLSRVVTRMAEAHGTPSASVHLLGKGEPRELPGVADVAERVRRIGAHSRSGDLAHAMEDALYLAVLAAVAQGAQEPEALAATALQTRKYEFRRYT